MSSEWQKSTLGELLSFANGKSSPERFDNAQFAVFGSNGLIGKANEFNSQMNSIVVGRVGSYCGAVHFSSQPCWVTDNAIKATAKGSNDSLFLFYVLKQLNLNNWRSGSGQPLINQSTLNAIEVRVPFADEQKNIAAFIGALDDRITLLRETNVTLEAIAQALFKSWFVDFDPVRAKMEGRAPEGMDEANAALFPDAFEESELGLVPRGWGVGSIYEVAKVTYGAPFSSKLFKTESPGKPLVRIRDLRDECPGVFTEEVHPKGYLLQPGDIVVGMDGEFRAYLWGGEEAWLNQRVCVFHPHNGASSAFVRLSIKPLLAAVEATESATTVIHLGKNDIDRFRVAVPSKRVLEAFAEVTAPLYDRLIRNKQQMQTLSSLRDTLLPRLISGQLRLSEERALLGGTA